MNKYSVLASPNCCNFISSSKHFVHNGMGRMNIIMALKNHYALKFVHGSMFIG